MKSTGFKEWIEMRGWRSFWQKFIKFIIFNIKIVEISQIFFTKFPSNIFPFISSIPTIITEIKAKQRVIEICNSWLFVSIAQLEFSVWILPRVSSSIPFEWVSYAKLLLFSSPHHQPAPKNKEEK